MPEKVLDAPDIKDDYYLNLLDWSSRGILAIGLTEKVYLYSTKKIKIRNFLCRVQITVYIIPLVMSFVRSKNTFRQQALCSFSIKSKEVNSTKSLFSARL